MEKPPQATEAELYAHPMLFVISSQAKKTD